MSAPSTCLLADDAFRVSYAGVSCVLLDAGRGPFELTTQQRLWALSAHIAADRPAGVRETVLGMNNLLLAFDPLVLHPKAAAQMLQQRWHDALPLELAGRDITVPVSYGGKDEADLAEFAAAVGMDRDEVIKIHSEAVYTVACLGSMPGLAYLAGLPNALTLPRRQVPRAKVRAGSVIVGGVQASVLPSTAPSGWHVLGSTQLPLFDPQRTPPCLFAPGDRVRFMPSADQP